MFFFVVLAFISKEGLVLFPCSNLSISSFVLNVLLGLSNICSKKCAVPLGTFSFVSNEVPALKSIAKSNLLLLDYLSIVL